jgi:hypothetical protein
MKASGRRSWGACRVPRPSGSPYTSLPSRPPHRALPPRTWQPNHQADVGAEQRQRVGLIIAVCLGRRQAGPKSRSRSAVICARATAGTASGANRDDDACANFVGRGAKAWHRPARPFSFVCRANYMAPSCVERVEGAFRSRVEQCGTFAALIWVWAPGAPSLHARPTQTLPRFSRICWRLLATNSLRLCGWNHHRR